MIDLKAWCLKNQNLPEHTPEKLRHVRCVIKHFNLVERQIQLGRAMSVQNAVPKVGN